MIAGERTVKEIVIILSAAILVAFVVNVVSPNGISLMGSWDTSEGVISARAKTDVVEHSLEIDSVEEAKEIYDAGRTLFVDARHTDRYHEGAVKGAVSLSIYDYEDRIEAFIDTHGMDIRIVTYCSGRECDESHELAQRLLTEGYTNVRVFIDGYPSWEAEGFPVESPKEKM